MWNKINIFSVFAYFFHYIFIKSLFGLARGLDLSGFTVYLNIYEYAREKDTGKYQFEAKVS